MLLLGLFFLYSDHPIVAAYENAPNAFVRLILSQILCESTKCTAFYSHQKNTCKCDQIAKKKKVRWSDNIGKPVSDLYTFMVLKYSDDEFCVVVGVVFIYFFIFFIFISGRWSSIQRFFIHSTHTKNHYHFSFNYLYYYQWIWFC